ncbi:MAG: hypothetical protein WCA46_22945, partial [Actinocatenispora sp.]
MVDNTRFDEDILLDVPTGPGGQCDRSPVGQHGPLLREATEAAARLLDRDGDQPQSVRVRAGDVAIELTWPGPAPVVAAQVTAPAAPDVASAGAPLGVP